MRCANELNEQALGRRSGVTGTAGLPKNKQTKHGMEENKTCVGKDERKAFTRDCHFMPKEQWLK